MLKIKGAMVIIDQDFKILLIYPVLLLKPIILSIMSSIFKISNMTVIRKVTKDIIPRSLNLRFETIV
jgi:hypothetical protein